MEKTYIIYKTPGKVVLWELPADAAKILNLRENRYVQLRSPGCKNRDGLYI